MAQVFLTTYQDIIDHLTDYGGLEASVEAARIARRSVQAAYNTMGNSHKWSYYYNTNPMQTGAATVPASTIQYSTATNQVTLTNATWPSWANLGSLLINNFVYDVASVQSPTVLTLTNQSNQGRDIPAGTTYTLYQDSYVLPADFLSCDEMINLNNLILLSYEHPREWLSRQRIVHTPAIPRLYTVTGDPHFFGSLAARFFPPPDASYNLNFLYARKPRDVVTWDYHTGTIAAAGTTAVTGTNTAWTPAMVGSVFRCNFAASPNNIPPTGLAGANPFYLERVITAVGSNTSLTVDNVIPDTLTGVLHEVSDPVDYESGAMYSYFLRECERQFRIARRIETTKEEMLAYTSAKFEAWEADSRSFAVRAAGQRGEGRIRLAYMPRGPDVS
jgi:hypothetical protein